MKPALLVLALLLTGCAAHSQLPPTVHTVTITITPPAQSTDALYVTSRVTASGTCPAPDVTTPNYAPLNSSAPSANTRFVDSAAAGLSVCYIVQMIQGGAISGPSNVAGPFVVPANPTAPSINGQTAENIPPMLKPMPQVAGDICVGCGDNFVLPAYIAKSKVTSRIPYLFANGQAPQIHATVQ